jgi:outer membrane cobalamin receptor
VRNVPNRGLITLAFALAFAGAPALAQQTPAPAPAPAPAAEPAVPAVEEPPVSDTANEIVVIADSLRGQVDAPEPPLLELKAEDIAAYGASSVSELLDALSSVTGSGRGRGGGGPAILVNGVRIANFREIASYPPEAIEKVEVLPEEVALRYGFSADQRVVNFVLKRSYSNRNIELTYGQPWRGGYSNEAAEATYLQLAGNNRLNFNARYNTTSGLTEFDRGVIQSAIPLAGDPDPALYRTLVGQSSSAQITGNYST